VTVEPVSDTAKAQHAAIAQQGFPHQQPYSSAVSEWRPAEPSR
jgi:hypothetical protein